MSDTTFVNGTTLTDEDWFNDLNRLHYTILGDPANAAAVLAAIGAKAAFSPSSIRLSTSNGYGSTNTKIRRYSTSVVSLGTDITYADSATDGASFTINTAGVYFVSCQDQFAGNNRAGISLNSSQLTTSIDTITTADALAFGDTGAANNVIEVSATIYCAVNDVIRPHGDGGAAGATTTNAKFTITRVS